MQVEKVLIKYAGRSFELAVSEMDLAPDNPSDQEVKDAAAVRVSQILAEEGESVTPDFSNLVVDPPQNERQAGQHPDKTVLNMRPPASYGPSL